MTDHEEDARLIEEALHCADMGNAGHWPTAAGYLADGLRAERERANAYADELGRIRAGADATPAELGTEMTPGQLWHKLLGDDPARREAFFQAVSENMRTAHRCIVGDHEGVAHEIEAQREMLSTAVFGSPTLDSFGQCVAGVRALRHVMVDGIAARGQVLSTEVDGAAEWLDTADDFPQERDTVAKIGEQLKSAGIDLRSVCGYEWSTDDASDPCMEHACGLVNPLHVDSHVCEQGCGATLSHVEAEKLAEAGQ